MNTSDAERAVHVRSVRFFAEPDDMAEIKRRINDDVLPRFSQPPEFLGFLALLAEHQTGDHRHDLLARWTGKLRGNLRDVPRRSGTKSSASPVPHQRGRS